MNRFKISALALLLPLCSVAQAEESAPLTLGASVAYAQSPYKGGQDRWLPLPVINYEGDSFWLRTLQGGYYLWKDPQNQLSLTLAGSAQRYDPDDNDLGAMKGLDERRMTMMGGLEYRHIADWGIVRTNLLGDVLGKSDGIVWDLTYLYRFEFGDFSLAPGIGATWTSANQNRYYYGVSGHEAARTGIRRYQPDDSWSPYAELSANYRLTERWNTSVYARYTRLADEIKDSPMVDKNSQLTTWAGISYSF